MTQNNNKTTQQDGEHTQREEQHKNHEHCAEQCKEQISQLLEQLSAAKDRYTRLFADIENMKRRETEEQRLRIELTQKKIFLDLLPIVDNFERAIQTEIQKETNQSGIQLIYAIFVKFLKQQDISEIDTSGEFDPEIHEAISQISDSTKKPGSIITVFEKGYYLHHKVLRHAKVAVAV